MRKQTFTFHSYLSAHSLKRLLCFFLVLFLSLTATAQRSPSPDSTESRYFVGMSLSSTSYPIMGDRKYESFGGILPIANVYYGYKLSKRSTVQLGIGYGANELEAFSSTKHRYHRIRGIALPLTFKYTPFNPHRRLQLYVNASIAPVFGHIKAKATEEIDGVPTLLYDEQSPTFDLVATAGFTLNYSISKRLDLYADVILLYKNFYYNRPAWNYYQGKSAGVGVNYRLR